MALFEAGVAPPVRIIGVSIGAMNGATIAAFPNLAGTQMLREIWLSGVARDVFRPRPLELLLGRLRRQRSLSLLSSRVVTRLLRRQLELIGVDSFEQLKIPFEVGVTDLSLGVARTICSGPLLPALLASSAIPGIFPSVTVDGHVYVDGGVADNEALGRAIETGARDVIVIGVMASPPLEGQPASWSELILRTLAVGLQRRFVSDFERLQGRARVTVICPRLPSSAGWNLDARHVDDVIQRTRDAMLDLISKHGLALFRRSAIHYLELGLGED
jgi:NTE family protein